MDLNAISVMPTDLLLFIILSWPISLRHCQVTLPMSCDAKNSKTGYCTVKHACRSDHSIREFWCIHLFHEEEYCLVINYEVFLLCFQVFFIYCFCSYMHLLCVILDHFYGVHHATVFRATRIYLANYPDLMFP